MAAERRPNRDPLIVSIVGTRPEAIKMRPVVAALRNHGGFEQRVMLTGQHAGLAPAFDFLPGEAVEQLDLDPTEQSAGELRDSIHHALCGRLHRAEADLVLVQGDTSSAYAGALAARDRGIALGHVEAGLRSFDLAQPWPEEGYRIGIDALSDLLFAPTQAAVRNLEADPGVRGAVYLTGNSGIDALLQALDDVDPLPSPNAGRKRILLTCHRRENRGEPLRELVQACRRLVRDLPVEITLPLHRSAVVRDPLEQALRGESHVHLVEPLEHRDMVAAMAASWLIITDSGGIQEEAPALGRPMLVLRHVTERPEALAGANAELVGTDADRIVAAVCALLGDEVRYARMAQPRFPFGDGNASIQIAQAVEAFFACPPEQRRLAAPLPLPCLEQALS
ncbi:MAG TPA: UDP-N-acetylglucosamine 2-epimerase (non-hydrolyzing) [Allosphingosinicella sp.]